MPIETHCRTTDDLSQCLFGSIHPQGWVPIETERPRDRFGCHTPKRSIHPQGWVPIETQSDRYKTLQRYQVAFTPKGGCPLKRRRNQVAHIRYTSSIHPQGWVPIETHCRTTDDLSQCLFGSIHPQGWVLIRVQASDTKSLGQVRSFALTPLAPLIRVQRFGTKSLKQGLFFPAQA